MGQTRAIDVSAWNGTIDWNKVKDDGVRTAIIRICCANKEDEKFVSNYIGAKRAGLSVGCYFVPKTDNVSDENAKQRGEEQAKVCLYFLKGIKIDLPVYLDWEYNQDKNVSVCVKARTDFFVAFCDYLKKNGVKPGVYTNVDYIVNKLEYNRLKKYDLFLAYYIKSSPWETKDSNNRKFYKASLWQFGTGSVNGISGQVDCDWHYV